MDPNQAQTQIRFLRGYVRTLQQESYNHNQETMRLKQQTPKLLNKGLPFNQTCSQCQSCQMEVASLKQRVGSLERQRSGPLIRGVDLSNVPFENFNSNFAMNQRSNSKSQLRIYESVCESGSTVVGTDKPHLGSETWKQKTQELQRRLHCKQNIGIRSLDQVMNLQNTVAELQRKILLLKSQLYQAKSEVQIKSNEVNKLKLQLLPPRKIMDPDPQHQHLKSELSSLRLKYDALLAQCTELRKLLISKPQVEFLHNQLNSVKLQVENKENQILRLKTSQQEQLRRKDQSLKTLEIKISTYESKVSEISAQFEKHLSAASSVPECPPSQCYSPHCVLQKAESKVELYLRSQVRSLGELNKDLSNQIINQRKQAGRHYEKVRSLENRIRLLESTNCSLQLELKKCIEARVAQTTKPCKVTLETGQESSLKQRIQELEDELVHVKRTQNKTEREAFKSQVLSEIPLSALNKQLTRPVTSLKQPLEEIVNQGNSKGQSSILQKNLNLKDQNWRLMREKISELKKENAGLKKTLLRIGNDQSWV